MMEYFYAMADSTKLPYMCYAHTGAGHPHTNFICRDPKEKERGHQALLACCHKAAELAEGWPVSTDSASCIRIFCPYSTAPRSSIR